MIRHRPFGSEHPYATTGDQRVPARPEVGQQVTLGVAAAPAVTGILCRWVADRDGGTSVTELPMTREPDPGSRAAAADAGVHSVAPEVPVGTDAATDGDGHLAAAQARAGRGAGSHWTVEVPAVEAGTRYRYRFTATAADGRVRRSREFVVDPVSWVADAPGCSLRVPTDRLIGDSIRWLHSAAGVHRVRFALRLDDGERVVGFGERFDRLDQRGHRLDAVVFEQYKSQGEHGRTYLPMPFAHVVSPSGPGWGLHVRTTRRSWYDVDSTGTGRLVVEVDLGGTDREQLDVAIHHGTPSQVLDAFLAEVGRPEELPDWVFRLWASGNEWNTQQLVLERMDAHRDLDIPVGAVVIEAWSDEQTFAAFRDARYDVTADGAAHQGSDFTYPAEGAWPDPAGMVAELHRRGIKVVLWQIPLQKMRPHPRGQARADAEALVRDRHAVLEADGRPYRNRGWWFPQALVPDLSVQRTRDWWTGKRRYLVTDLDVDGFKTDGGEHPWGHDLRYADGRRGDEGNNLFPVHYARAFGDLLRSAGKAPVTFSRAGFAGSQAHGIVWAGDEDSTWPAFRHSITAGLTASACGILYWSWDLAGFSGPVPDPELYLRAAAAATFMPVMQYHSEFHHHRRPLRDRTPWNIAEQSGDARVVEVFRSFAHLRETLVPYLAAQARDGIAHARPLLRALFFDHADDPEVWNHPLQYLLGSDLLVHPVTEAGADSWATYLPAGDWVDVWTGEAIFGGRSVRRPTPVDVIPVYCRAESWTTMAALFGHHDTVPTG
ncbi:glycoside hydrolase family 31 protein [Nakamurella endophytica]|uniref:Glycoside hydrolase family 31 n=1 Tax=Nakamurella endophytica TaxID=1748367 RepID=A0A917SNV0_9ACTN|nr:TIM-barrel domain-containing protein [Nakamurella endophytica]GGL89503.1 hypothetical protein GCM10011594_06410 [Nakamurella endophytica]